MLHRLPGRAGLFGVLLVIAGACGTGPDDLEVAGTWQGTAQLPDAYSTTLTLTQSGSTVTGTLRISGLLDQTLVGTLDESARTIVWTALSGCQQWSGTFTIDSDGSQMSGPVLNDQSGCSPPGSDSSGTISLSKA